ncbi:LADA_0C04786g1_1 [Lachancea dasiensis]|uniref:Telomerase reverse transcriptase n=1 Tax=Lachancea dasiensis TaxID=1072105 RepID=A0A1G4IYS3_9SACH|nr:LADA_0C04786g1_1 [Lachancea dasiensis]
MKCLRDLIYPDVSNSVYIRNYDSPDRGAVTILEGTYADFWNKLQDVYVEPYSDRIHKFSTTISEHASVVDECVSFLKNAGLPSNVLAIGYKIAKNVDVASKLHCESSNFNVTRLKCGLWKTIHRLWGTEKFVDLIINNSIYEYNDGVYYQLTGPTHDWTLSPLSGSTARRTVLDISNSTFTYRNRGDCRTSAILPRSPKLLVSQIFGNIEDVSGNNKSSKRLERILSLVIKKHRKLKYRFMFDASCPSVNLEECESNLDAQICAKSVTQYLASVTCKLFPVSFFGSKHNRSKILSKISLIVGLKLHDRIPIDILLEGLKVKDIEWLGRSTNLDITELRKRQTILVNVVQWFFGQFCSSIIKTFFYCTELSATRNLIYFRFDIWEQITRPFLDNYFKKFLKTNEKCQEHTDSMNYKHGFLRLIPKVPKHQFRVIFVPLKSHPDAVDTQLDYIRNVIKPTGRVLNYILGTEASSSEFVFSKTLSSPNEIPDAILTFKSWLTEVYKSVPQLFFIKFDIESCYDSIPTLYAREVIRKRLTTHVDFFVRSQSVYNPNKDVIRRQYIVNGDVEIDKDCIAIDEVLTTYLTKVDILRVIDEEMNKSSMIYGRRCYLRSSGIFQGSNLSANIVELLYDDLVTTEAVFQDTRGAPAMILRLADDFLVVSTSKSYIEAVGSQVKEGFQTHGAYPNNLKVMTNVLATEQTYVRFCAMDINLEKLEVVKHIETLNPIYNFASSAKKRFTRLRSIFESRLNGSLTNPGLNSWPTIVKQVFYASLSTVRSLKFHDRRSLSPLNLLKFIKTLLCSSIRCCAKLSHSNFNSSDLKIVIAKAFLEAVEKKYIKVKMGSMAQSELKLLISDTDVENLPSEVPS